jgi:hypothetical protein
MERATRIDKKARPIRMDAKGIRIATIRSTILTPKIYDENGNYRRRLSSNLYDPDSVSNPYGRYGNPYSVESVNNPYDAGNPYSNSSPTKPYGRGMSVIGGDGE